MRGGPAERLAWPSCVIAYRAWTPTPIRPTFLSLPSAPRSCYATRAGTVEHTDVAMALADAVESFWSAKSPLSLGILDIGPVPCDEALGVGGVLYSLGVGHGNGIGAMGSAFGRIGDRHSVRGQPSPVL